MSVSICLFLTATAAAVSAVNYPLAPAPLDVEESNFAYQLKSFRQQLDECAEYLQISQDSVKNLVANNYITEDATLKCMIRCVGINAGWWSVGGNNSGLHTPVIESYFAPGCADSCYVKRTEECISANVSPCQDDCSQAYRTFLCYYHQYGNLKHSKEYIPVQQQDAVQAAIDCILTLRIPKELLEQYAKGVVPHVPETECLYRCQYLAEGLYDGNSLNLTRIYIRNYKTPAPQIKGPDVQECAVSGLSNTVGECARLFKVSTCADRYADPDFSAKLFLAASRLVLAQRTCLDEDLNPRYNVECATKQPLPCGS